MPVIDIPRSAAARDHPAPHSHRIPRRPGPRRIRRHRPGRAHLALGPARRRTRADQPHGLATVRRRRAAIGRHPRRGKHRREPPLYPPTSWAELNKARFIGWLCTSPPGDEVSLRFRPLGRGPRTCCHRRRIGHFVTMREVFDLRQLIAQQRWQHRPSDTAGHAAHRRAGIPARWLIGHPQPGGPMSGSGLYQMLLRRAEQAGAADASWRQGDSVFRRTRSGDDGTPVEDGPHGAGGRNRLGCPCQEIARESRARVAATNSSERACLRSRS